MSDHEAAGAAITDFNQAIARHAGALKLLESYGRVAAEAARAGSRSLEVRPCIDGVDCDALWVQDALRKRSIGGILGSRLAGGNYSRP